jgi:hypothetical protein
MKLHVSNGLTVLAVLAFALNSLCSTHSSFDRPFFLKTMTWTMTWGMTWTMSSTDNDGVRPLYNNIFTYIVDFFDHFLLQI